ncbi:MAG: nitroreductase family protein [Firmicutes bacterium]|jgi:nitroreductase|nr:nitroreductase family protein [Bacillota bacterium]
MNNILEVIKKRRSVRMFKPDRVKKEDLEAVMEAAIYAPSARNLQPWHFTVITDDKLINELSSLAKAAMAADHNSLYQRRAADANFHVFHHAPVVIIVSGAESSPWAQADCAAATQNIMLAAEALGIGTCWVNLFLFAFRGEGGEALLGRLGIPEGYRPLYSIALGYKAHDNWPVPPRKKDCINYL